MPSKQLLGIILALCAGLFYGLYTPAARAAYDADVNTVAMILVTVAMRGLTMLAFCGWQRKTLFKDIPLRISATNGFWQAVSIAGIFFALNYLSGAIVILIVFTHTLMLLALLVYKKEVPFDFWAIISTFLALWGLSFVLGVWQPYVFISWAGVAFALMAAFATFNRLYLYGRLTQFRHPIVVGAETFVFATLFLLPLVLWQTPYIPTDNVQAWGWLLLSGVSLSVATFCMFYGISLLGSFRYTLIAKVEPAFAALFALVLFGERLEISQYMGMVLVLIALVMFQYKGDKRI